MLYVGQIYPEYQVATSTDTTNIKCSSAGSVHWIKDGRVVSVVSLLVIHNITEKDGGNYTCHGYMDASGATPFMTTSTLLVAGMIGLATIVQVA